MGLFYKNLDEVTRKYMLEENLLGNQYKSPRIVEGRMHEWIKIFTDALGNHSDDWLANETNRRRLMKQTETRKTPSGGTTEAKVPVNAAQQLAEGEFNRYYLRGLAARAIAEGKTHLLIYRGKSVSQPRPDSEQKIGTLVDAKLLLEELRRGDFVDNALGLPPGPNSGLTAELP
jgi:hypothetical protein